MKTKIHNDPIIYRAYGTVRGVYQPNSNNPTTGILTTDDGVKFPATVSYDIAVLLENNPDKLASMALWKCYFRTRPTALLLRAVKTEKVEKNRQHSFRVNKFQVDGKVIKTGKDAVSVQIQPNESSEKPFTVTLKGNIDGDLSHKFWRFKLRRRGKSYYIENAYPIGLPKTETPPLPKQERQGKPKTPTPPLAAKEAKEPTPTHKPRVFDLVNRKLK
jgi:hypothetical protein